MSGSAVPRPEPGAVAESSPAVEPVVPFNRPSIEGAELDHVAAAMRSGQSGSQGPYTEAVGALLRDEMGAAEVLLTTSGTAALELAALLLDLQPGDTVIVPSFTFVTTALAFVRAGARVLFADIEDETLGLDPQHVASLIDDSVRAVVPVHYAGVAGDLAGLAAVLDRAPGVDLIEDNAHGLYSRYRGQALGSFGRFAALSFHETKTFTCGEGGALVLTHPADVERGHTLHDKGTNRRAFRNGTVDEYTWVDAGSSFALADVLAAYLLGQLEAQQRIIEKRRSVWEHYWRRLEPHADRLGFRLPVVPDDRVQSFPMFYVQLRDRPTRDRVLAALRAVGIMASFHYVPLHRSPMGARIAASPPVCPVTEAVSGRLLRLPFFNTLSAAEVDRVADRFIAAVEHAG